MAIPVLHDDQHGTAVVVAAALLKALDRTGRTLGSAHIVISGAGAAGVACARMLLAMGADAERLWLCDIHGVLHSERADLNRWTQRFARATEARPLADVAAGTGVLSGASAAGAFTPPHVTPSARPPTAFT